MEIKGKVTQILPAQSGTSKSGKTWRKQNFVIETIEKYPRKLCFQLFGDKVNECPASGEEVTVSFDIDSSEYNGRWYTQLSAWKVVRPEAQPAPVPPVQTQPYVAPAPAQDDLPF